MNPIGSSPLWAAIVALVDAVIAVLVAFHVGPTLTTDQRSAIIGILGAGFVLTSLGAAYFQHQNALFRAAAALNTDRKIEVE